MSIQKVYEDNLRFYVLEDQTKLISVTSLIGAFPDPSLFEWRRKVGEKLANKISKKAATRGTAVHKMIEDRFDDQLDMMEHHPDHVKVFNLFTPVIETGRVEPILKEEILYDKWDVNIAGQVDCIGMFDGVKSIIDFKTSNKMKKRDWIKNYFLQTFAYKHCYEKMCDEKEINYVGDIEQVVILIACEEEKVLQIFKEPANKHDEYVNCLREMKKELDRRNNGR